jgi:hypothetical protein
LSEPRSGVIVNPMAPSTPLALSPEDKLDLLRYLDEFRFWRSLDDERRCGRCHQFITGRQILVFGRQGTRGNIRLQCPTPGCCSGPGDWTYANPVLTATRPHELRAEPKKLNTDAAKMRIHRVDKKARFRRKKPQLMKSSQASQAATQPAPSISWRRILARHPILRPLATGLHGIRPVA